MRIVKGLLGSEEERDESSSRYEAPCAFLQDEKGGCAARDGSGVYRLRKRGFVGTLTLAQYWPTLASTGPVPVLASTGQRVASTGQ